MNSAVFAAGPVRKNILQEYNNDFYASTNGSNNFRASPTDLLMTPCTAKLQAHKQKRYNK